jgi:hypothetical protein
LTSRSPDPAAVDALLRTIRERYPGVQAEATPYPSGGLFIDVRLDQRAWVLMYSVTHDSYGIDELGDDEAFTAAYAHTATGFEDAARTLLELLEHRAE